MEVNDKNSHVAPRTSLRLRWRRQLDRYRSRFDFRRAVVCAHGRNCPVREVSPFALLCLTFDDRIYLPPQNSARLPLIRRDLDAAQTY